MTKDAILKKFKEEFTEVGHVLGGHAYLLFKRNADPEDVESFLLSSLDEVERETYKTGVNNALELISACYSPQSGNYNEEVQKDITRAREILLSPSSEKLPKEEEHGR